MSYDWSAGLSRRARGSGGGEIAAILAQSAASDVITFSGGFPDPATFPTYVLAEIATRVITTDPAVSLQYAPAEGLPGTRACVASRIARVDGREPTGAELMITSGGMECLGLLARIMLDPGDTVAAEAPTYLGAIMAFRGYQADVRGVPMDNQGMRVDVLADLLGGGLRPKILYTIPDYQNPTGLSMTAERRSALVELARRYGFLVAEDVAYAELGFGEHRPPSLWSLAPDVVVQVGTFSKTFFPGARLGWAAGPAEIIAHLVTAKQTSDQCAGALSQRMLEEYGRGGQMDAQLTASRDLYARRAELMVKALAEHLPPECTWTAPRGGFFTWVSAPETIDTVALSAPAREHKVAYVAGRPFYADGSGANQLRLSYSRVADELIDEGISRLGRLLRSTREGQ